jgi:hypothetical protein
MVDVIFSEVQMNTLHSLRQLARRRAGLLAIALVPAISFGPPWLSIEVPPNPFDAASRGAVLVVHTYHHGLEMDAKLSGSAEGLVQGTRRSLPLRFESTTHTGTYALHKQWPNEGTWMLLITTTGEHGTVTAMVDLDPAGSVSAVRVPTVRERGMEMPRAVTTQEVEAALRKTVALR